MNVNGERVYVVIKFALHGTVDIEVTVYKVLKSYTLYM